MYSVLKLLLTFILETDPQIRFNQHLKSARCSVERMYGIWKRRFPCLSKGMALNFDTSLSVICATAVLHNICQARKEEQFTEGDIYVHPPRKPETKVSRRGITVRDQIVRHYFT